MKYYLTVILLLFLSACKTQDTAPSPDEATTDDGVPEGEAVSQVVGASGGTLVSADGLVRVEVPAGALSSDTHISIQALSNKAPNGVGKAYRFSPDGTEFKKPARLTMRYDGASALAYDPIRIAFQEKDRMWYPAGEVTADFNRKEVTVDMPHFSDWSVVEMAQLTTFMIEGGTGTVGLGESIELQVIELVPLVGGSPLRLRAANAQNWEVGGAGNGTIKFNGNKATYTAPSVPPQQNPVTISVDVRFANRPGSLRLVKEIMVGESFATFIVDGETYSSDRVNLIENDGHLNISAGIKGGSLELEVSARKTGTFSFGRNWDTPGYSGANILLPDGRHFEHYTYCDGERLVITKGEVKIDRYVAGKYAVGSFSGNVIHLVTGNCRPGPPVSGKFLAVFRP